MSISPEELRIGNLVIAKNIFNGNQMTVDGIGLTVFFKGMHVGEYVKDIEGIDLTPEWLERCGFEYAEGFADDYTKQPITLYNNPFKKGWTIENLFGHQITEDLLVVEYVHQLQNLFFALTGKELNIKL